MSGAGPRGAADVVELEGELDLVNAGVLQDALSATSASTVIVDLAVFDSVDSIGLAVGAL